MSDPVKAQPGDVYCVFCLSERISMRIEQHDIPTWECLKCKKSFEQNFQGDEDGRFSWIWDAEHPAPNPGCPWCGTRNIRGVHVTSRGDGQFICRRLSCGKTWRGGFSVTESRSFSRWRVRVPVESVPWASGTVADLECYRNHPGAVNGECYPDCCRWPKSCSAFDPGFTTGKGRTTLPVVWFDGFGYRSGPPDPKTIPEHLFDPIWAAWKAALPDPVEEANDDDGDDCGNGCEYICYHPEART
jgi:transposase-like protein